MRKSCFFFSVFFFYSWNERFTTLLLNEISRSFRPHTQQACVRTSFEQKTVSRFVSPDCVFDRIHCSQQYFIIIQVNNIIPKPHDISAAHHILICRRFFPALRISRGAPLPLNMPLDPILSPADYVWMRLCNGWPTCTSVAFCFTLVCQLFVGKGGCRGLLENQIDCFMWLYNKIKKINIFSVFRTQGR